MFRVSVSEFTPESIEAGEVANSYFDYEGGSLREALDVFGYGAQGIEADSWPVTLETPPRYITNYLTNDGTRDYYEKGIEENRTLSLPRNITPSSALRIARLVGVRC
jgi:hypothetical protein